MLAWLLVACPAEQGPDVGYEDSTLAFTCDPEIALVEPNPSCELEPAASSFTPVTEWYVDQFDPLPESREVAMTPVVGHLTDDNGDRTIGSDGDTPDIVFVTDALDPLSSGAVLRVLSGDDGHAHFSVVGLELQPSGGFRPRGPG